jgi:selenocysteine lyase/cysteine desulfurase
VEAVMCHFEHRDELACADFLSWFDDADRIRASIARLIHCSADDIAFVPNASTALGLLFSGISWRTGDRIVTLENEFPNNLYFPAHLETRGVEFVETCWQGFYDSIDERTRLVLMSTASYIDGFRPPVEEVSRFLRERDVLLYVDGTQSIGAIRFDAAAVQPDMLAVHGYKWLLSPNGSGFIYVSPQFRKQLQPNVIGWRSDRRWREVNQLHHGAPEFVDAAEKYEGGMLNFPGVYAMGASVEMMLELGAPAIEERVLQLSSMCRNVLERAGGVIAHPDSHILAARFSDADASALSEELKRQSILVSARHGYLRVSAHFYNNEEDMEKLAEALQAR